MSALTRLPVNAATLNTATLHDIPGREPHIPERVIGERRHYRTVWVSDIHLGTRGCNAALLIDFFDHIDCEIMYLVGDIIDGWRLKKRLFWPPEHNDIVWRVLKRARRGTRVIYIPGNHDEMMRPFAGLNFGGVEIARDCIHETADGRRLLVLHGDEFDAVMLAHRWIAFVGDGPARAQQSYRYPDARFLGPMVGGDLAAAYAGADVFVFPSRTDTFGLVVIEALASGTPVAAYPVTGPRDIVTDGAGVLHDDINTAISRALACSREAAASVGRQYSWKAATVQFVAALAPARAETLADAA
jgi:glycosyltransferase involved in cell wall biosynthesis